MTQAHRRRALRRTALRRTALAGVAVAALGVTAACGAGSADSTSKDAAAPTSTATATPKAAPTATATATARATATVDSASVKRLFAHAVSAASTVHVALRLAGQIEMSGSGDMDMKADPVQADLRLASPSLGSDGIRVLMIDNAMYLHLAQLGEKYVKVSLTDKNSPLSQLGLSGLDPSALFDRFSHAISGGTIVGKETIDGTATEHYRLTVDAKAVASALPSVAAQPSAIPDTETIDVWFDGDGRFKQLSLDTGGETVTESFSDWGEPVTVQAPPAGQVQDMTSMLNGMVGSQGSTAG